MILPLLVGCAATDPVPDDLSEPLVWLLAHLDADEDEVAPRVEQLDAYVRSFDAEADVADRTFTPDRPTAEHLADLGAAGDPDRLTAVAVVRFSQHEERRWRGLVGATPRPCLEGPAWTTWDRTFLDGACLVDALCDEAATTEAGTLGWFSPPLAVSLTSQHRVVALSDGRDALLTRTWLDAAAVASDGALEARLAVDLVLPDLEDERRAWRAGARWVDARWATDAPEATTELVPRLVDEVEGGGLAAETWLEVAASACPESG